MSGVGLGRVVPETGEVVVDPELLLDDREEDGGRNDKEFDPHAARPVDTSTPTTTVPSVTRDLSRRAFFTRETLRPGLRKTGAPRRRPHRLAAVITRSGASSHAFGRLRSLDTLGTDVGAPRSDARGTRAGAARTCALRATGTVVRLHRRALRALPACPARRGGGMGRGRHARRVPSISGRAPAPSRVSSSSVFETS